MRSGIRFTLLGLLAALTLVVSPAAGGTGRTLVVSEPLSVGADPSYVVQTLDGVPTGSVPMGGSSGGGLLSSVAADQTVVTSGEFGGHSGGGFPVWVDRPDGRSVEVDPSPYDMEASISYDGSKVTFARLDPKTGSSDIYVVDSDGSGLRLVASGGPSARLEYPEFSPDGGSIAYDCGPAVADTVGSSSDCGPLMDGSYRHWGVMLMNADGSDKRMILVGESTRVSWSPDGQWIAMEGCQSLITPLGWTCIDQVFVYRTDGSDLFNDLAPSRQVTHQTDPWGTIDPQFCGADSILYNELVDDSGNRGWLFYRINPDGTDRQEIHPLSPESYPWSEVVCVPSAATGAAPAPTVDATRLIVPSVRRLGLHAAKRRLRRAHLTVGKIRKAYSRGVARNHVVAQFPHAGARAHRWVKQGPAVKLVLSRGPRPTK